jgi:hypothetical protein
MSLLMPAELAVGLARKDSRYGPMDRFAPGLAPFGSSAPSATGAKGLGAGQVS